MSGGKQSNPRTPGLWEVLPKWLNLAKIWFNGPERWKARAYALSVVTLACLSTLLYVRISYTQKRFSTALSGKDVAGFYAAVGEFAVIICLAAPFFSFTLWVEDRLVLAWRAYLTKTVLDKYFQDNAFFGIHQQADSIGEAGDVLVGDADKTVTNPDQRICDDIQGFVRASTDIILSLIKKVLNCAAFASVLWGISHQLVAFLLCYAIVGTYLTTSVFGKKLAGLYNQLLSREGDLRFSLVRVSMMAESIAFYSGSQSEERVVNTRFGRVLETLADRVRWSALFDLWTRVYDYATILAPSLLTAPRYFRGEIEFGVISQASYAFSSIASALAVIINNLTQITGLAAQTERLDNLMEAILRQHHSHDDACDPPDHPCDTSSEAKPLIVRQDSVLGATGHIVRHLSPSHQGLHLSQLTVMLPAGRQAVCNDLNLTMQPGDSLLIVGPSGIGKSSLLRALAGLWRRGSGSVDMPSDVFFLPQRPFMPLGTLRDQCLFPTGSTTDMEISSTQGQEHHTVTNMTATARAWLPQTSNLRRRGSESDSGNATSTSSTLGSKDVVELTPLLLGGAGQQGAPASPRLMIHVTTGTAAAGGGGGGGGAAVRPSSAGVAGGVSDAELLRRLEEVQLGGLAERVGGLDAECDWAQVLSPGQQQRIAILRLLLHQPALAFLDEATSALDHNTETLLYRRVRSQCSSFISVGHRAQLIHHHSHVLEAKPQPDGTTSWVMTTSAQYLSQTQAHT